MRAQEFLTEGKANPEMVNRIRDLIAQGLNAPQIAAATGLSRTAVNAYVLRHQLRPKPELAINRLTDQQKIELLKLYQSGTPVRHLEKQYNLSFNTIANFLKSQLGTDKYKQLAPTMDPAHKGTTPEQVQAWAELFAKGKPINWIAKKHNLTPANTRYWLEMLPNWAELRQQNIANRKTAIGDYRVKGITADDIQQMAKMFVTGQPYTSIAKQFGVDKSLVSRYLQKLPNFAELKQQHLNLRPAQFGGRQSTTKSRTNKSYSKGIHALGRTGPNIR
jgi:predicted transcriptional regulator